MTTDPRIAYSLSADELPKRLAEISAMGWPRRLAPQGGRRARARPLLLRGVVEAADMQDGRFASRRAHGSSVCGSLGRSRH
jgi:hypothetical protein